MATYNFDLKEYFSYALINWDALKPRKKTWIGRLWAALRRKP